MAVILRSRQTFYLKWYRKLNMPASMIEWSFTIIWAFDRHSSWNIDEDMAILKFGLLCVLVTSLTHWGRVTHLCVSKLTINDSDNGLSPGRRQVIIWTNAGILLIKPRGTNFNEILIKINHFSFRKFALENVVWKTAAILSRPQCVNDLRMWIFINIVIIPW